MYKGENEFQENLHDNTCDGGADMARCAWCDYDHFPNKNRGLNQEQLFQISLFVKISFNLEKYQFTCFIIPRFPVIVMKDIAPLVKIFGGVIVIFVILKVLDGFFHFTHTIMDLVAAIPYLNDIVILAIACIAMILIDKRL
jgi:hypothetical protein